MTQLTVAQLVPALNAGGVEQGTMEIARALVDAGHRSLVMSAGGRLVGSLTREKEIAPERIRLWQTDSLQVRDTNRLERPVVLFNFDIK